MGGGAIQTRAAGVHGGVPAAGLGTTNNDTHYTQTHLCTTVPAKDLLPHVGGGEGGAQIRPLAFSEPVLLHKCKHLYIGQMCVRMCVRYDKQ